MINNSLKERVHSLVIRDIINGEYTLDTIISEKQLCEKLQVSKSPVREALVELCSQGVLRSIPRRGYKIVRFTKQNIRDILQYRTMLECGCLNECFDSITPTQVCRLEDIVKNEFIYLSNLDPKDYWDGTLNFHLTLASYADNEYIYSQLRKALNTFMRAFLQFYWDKWKDNSFSAPSELHIEIVKNIRSGNKEAAIELLRQDINTLGNPKDEKREG